MAFGMALVRMKVTALELLWEQQQHRHRRQHFATNVLIDSNLIFKSETISKIRYSVCYLACSANRDHCYSPTVLIKLRKFTVLSSSLTSITFVEANDMFFQLK